MKKGIIHSATVFAPTPEHELSSKRSLTFLVMGLSVSTVDLYTHIV
jgi:hypothetical protein